MSEATEQHIGRDPRLRERIAGGLLRRWPFLSGCGALAWGTVGRTLLPPRPVKVWAKLEGRRCLVPLDDLVGRAIFLVGDLDPKITWVLDRVVAEGDTVLDVGANLGLVSLKMARRVGVNGRVLAFEPSPSILPYLRATVEANPVPEIDVAPIALGRRRAEMALAVPSGNAGGASLLSTRRDGKMFTVQVRRLASVLSEMAITSVDVMKIDVEGFEVEVLAGLLDDPAAPRPNFILFEELAPETSQCFGLLRGAGYRLFGLKRRAMLTMALVPESGSSFLQSHDFLAIAPDAPRARIAALGL